MRKLWTNLMYWLWFVTCRHRKTWEQPGPYPGPNVERCYRCGGNRFPAKSGKWEVGSLSAAL
jgi:hypothetical protein